MLINYKKCYKILIIKYKTIYKYDVYFKAIIEAESVQNILMSMSL